MNRAVPLDPFSFRFAGTQVIEASAGTGKTFTLATLYLRLLLGAGPGGRPLTPEQILVMTFTIPATQELKDRIRLRIAEAARVFREQPGAAPDDTLLALRNQFPVVQWPVCARRLERAQQEMDEAAIHTIHGWCSGMLRRHAFDSRSLFQQTAVEDREGLLREAVRDYWRQYLYALSPGMAALLQDLPKDPDELLQALKPRLGALDRDPQAQAQPAESPAEAAVHIRDWYARYQAAEQVAREGWRRNREAIEAQLREAWNTEQLSATNFPVDHREGYLDSLRAWSEGQPVEPDCLRRFSGLGMQKALRKGRTPVADTWGIQALLDTLVATQDARPATDRVLEHAVLAVRERFAQLKRTRASFDFNDLLQRLYHALHADEGQFAQALRNEYPVAMVDEFQDTDPWQYGALRRIYVEAPPDSTALVLIGDPKQAIYRFRGADLRTYLAARDAAQQVFSLADNYRSTQGVVNAVNRVFGQAGDLLGDLQFVPVSAKRDDIAPLRDAGGGERPALTVWQSPAAGLAALPLRRQMARGFAAGMAQLLADVPGLEPRHLAVLVRKASEALLVREALAGHDLRSVYLSDGENVYQSDEARDLWYVLRAVAQPRQPEHLRAALATRLLCFSPGDLEALVSDERQFEACVEQFVGWQGVWQRQGVLAMLYRLLHDQALPARLEAEPQGERRLTNLLHLGDLLQQASLSLQGEGALLRYLAGQFDAHAAEPGVAQMRLETDEALVKIITLHKAKGLQYPVVFIPFAFDFREDMEGAEGKAGRLDEQQPEDVRLLYVGFTRAERALFVGAAARDKDLVKPKGKAPPAAPKSALSRLLRRTSADDLATRLQDWSRDCADIRIDPLPPPDRTGYAPPQPAPACLPARLPRRTHDSQWRSSSFSALTRDHGFPSPGLALPDEDLDARFEDARQDNPEPAPAPAAGAYAQFPAGAAYGDLLHALLEWQVKAGWPLLDPATQRPDWRRLVEGHARALRLDEDAVALIEPWLRALARSPLGIEGDPALTLADLPASAVWAEMGFQFPTHGIDAAALDARIRAALLPGLAREPVSAQRLEGQFTGFMDLVFLHAGRYYVLDYKSNRLPDYAPARLAAAIAQHRYDLQYAVYTLALHRLLGQRLPDYDYDCHVGGAIYLFARGIDSPGNGIFRDRPPRALIEQLDAAVREARP